MKNSMMCREVRNALDENQPIGGMLSSHLSECKDCRKYRETLNALQSIQEPAPELYPLFREKLAAESGNPKHNSHPWYFIAMPIAATLLLVFGGISLYRLIPDSHTGSGISVASVSGEAETYNPEESDLEYYYEIAYR